MSVLALPSHDAAPGNAGAPATGIALDIEAVGKQFGARRVLDGIEIEVAPGEFVAIVGHSGCGKSTLLSLVAGLDQPTSGRIRFDGEPSRDRIGDSRMMFQDARLLPWKRVVDNVGLGLKGDWRKAALVALCQVGLSERAGDFPSVLSGGQKQRVALARALISRPRLLLLDEPLGALDALTRLEMQALIEETWRASGFTALLVTHDVAEAVTLADRVIVLEAGRVARSWEVRIPRPRRHGAPEVASLEAEILDRLLRRR